MINRVILFGLVAVIGLIVALVEPFYGLDTIGHRMLGTFIAALGAWIIRPGKGTFTAGTIVILLGGSFSGLPFTDITNGFAGPSFWLLIPAMFFGYALLKTGLGKRIVFGLFMNIKPTYGRLMVGWFVVGVIFSLFTPSIAVRFLILTPIAALMADACQLEKGSRGRSLMIIAAWTVSIYPGIAWQNGSFFGIVFSTFLPEGPMSAMATEDIWFRVMAPWIPMSLAYLGLLFLVLKPSEPLSIKKDEIIKMYNNLGPPSIEEKKCMAAFVFLVASLVAAVFLPIDTVQALFASFIILLVTGVFDVKDISRGINWDIVLFLGVILGFTHLFGAAGITDWLSPILAEFLRPIAASHFVFVLVLYVIIILLRFLDAAQGFIISAIMAMATPMLYTDFGIHPLVALMVFVCGANLFFFRYHQPWIGQVEGLIGDSGWNPKHLTQASILYMIFAAVFLVFCVVYWRIVGIL